MTPVGPEGQPVPRYRGVDFPESPLWLPRTALPGISYPQWAARTANQVALGWLDGQSPEVMLSLLAAERARLSRRMQRAARRTGVPADEDTRFGEPREGTSNSVLARGPLRTPWHRELQRLVHRRFGALGPPSAIRIMGFNTFHCLDGRRLRCSRVGLHPDAAGERLIYVIHPANPQRILGDVVQRLGRLRIPNRSRDEKLGDLLAAMFGFYNAMPYKRGSAAIGRSLFAGLFAATFGSKLIGLPDTTDARAMLLPQREFITTFLPILHAARMRGPTCDHDHAGGSVPVATVGSKGLRAGSRRRAAAKRT